MSFSEKVGYRGQMFSDDANWRWVMGYFRQVGHYGDLIGDLFRIV